MTNDILPVNYNGIVHLLVLEVFQQKRGFKKQQFQRYQWMDGLDCKCNLYFQICYSCSFQHQSPLVHRPTYFTHLYSNFILIWYHKMAYGLLTGRGHLLSDHGRSKSHQYHMKSLIDFNAPQQKIATKLPTTQICKYFSTKDWRSDHLGLSKVA